MAHSFLGGLVSLLVQNALLGWFKGLPSANALDNKVLSDTALSDYALSDKALSDTAPKRLCTKR